MVIAVDLDGTLAEYVGWRKDAPIGNPLPGAEEFLKKLRALGASIVVFTARSSTEQVNAWLVENKLDSYVTAVSAVKSTMFSVIVDDRAVRFDGDYDKVLEDVRKFVDGTLPWWKREKGKD